VADPFGAALLRHGVATPLAAARRRALTLRFALAAASRCAASSIRRRDCSARASDKQNVARDRAVVWSQMKKNQIDAVLERVCTWPAERQEDAARLLLEMEAQDASPYRLTDEQLVEVRRRRQNRLRNTYRSPTRVSASRRAGG